MEPDSRMHLRQLTKLWNKQLICYGCWKTEGAKNSSSPRVCLSVCLCPLCYKYPFVLVTLYIKWKNGHKYHDNCHWNLKFGFHGYFRMQIPFPESEMFSTWQFKSYWCCIILCCRRRVMSQQYQKWTLNMESASFITWCYKYRTRYNYVAHIFYIVHYPTHRNYS